MERDPVDMLIEDLGMQLAEKAVEASNWKVRALMAEQRLRESQPAEVVDDMPETDVVPLMPVEDDE